ncbi:MAG TPA: hypothetical protein VFE46_14795 [Pirellulales bacterium]|jgi:hypothetical protein|nr:hypothetical protein [Pirellulales bacterium]
MRIRKRLFIDRKVQGALMLRAVEYWFCCLLTVALALLAWSLITGPDQPLVQFFLDSWRFFLPTAVVSLLILPLLVYDILRLSNKFTGPLFRLRRELRRLAAGEQVPPMHFREGDFWPDLADEFNAVAQRMEMLAGRAEQGRKSAEPSQPEASKRASGTGNYSPAQSPERAGASTAGVAVKSPPEDSSRRDRLCELPR